MANSNKFFGFDLIVKLSRPSLKGKQDVVMCVIHWLLVRRGVKCVGNGSELSQPNTHDYIGEELPTDWNTGIVFNIRYSYNNDLLHLYGVKRGNTLVINLTHIGRDRIMGMVFNLDQVHSIHGTLDQMIPDIENVIRHIEETLINPIVPLVTRDTGTQTVEEASRTLPSRQTRSYEEEPGYNLRDLRRSDPLVRNIGYNDLNPLAQGPGGGMLFPSPGYPRPMMPDPNMPFPAPPGARFDPILPQGGVTGRGRGRGGGQGPRGYPDNDHLPPPGFDDWFM